MPTFTYTARDQQGTVQSGQLDAPSEDGVVNALQRRGLLVTAISQKDVARAQTGRGFALRRTAPHRMHGRAAVGDHVMVCDQMATLVEAGIPLLKALDVVMAQAESRTMLLALEAVRRDVAGGSTLRDGLMKHPAVFSKLWLNLVGTGEASGHLAQALRQLARHFESAQRLRSHVATALTYPIFLAVVMVVVVGIFVYWLIPKFSAIFATMNVQLPLITRLVVGFSHAARQYAVGIVLGAAAAAWGVKMYFRTTSGRWALDQTLLRLPLFGSTVAAVQLAEFGQGLSTLLESGVPLLSSLEILEESATNRVYGAAIGAVKEQVKEGKPMAGPLQASGLFPPMAVQMVQVGEEIGELGKMVARVAKFYEERVEHFIARLSRLFEPIAIVVIGGFVLMIVLAIFLPLIMLTTQTGAA